MHELYEIKEQLMDELKEYRNKQKKSMDDITVIKYLTSSIDHLCNIIEKAEDEEYSMRGGQGGGYSRENRYSREGGRGGNRYAYEGGQGGESFARGRGNNARRDSMGRYSREGGYSRTDGMENLVDYIHDVMNELPQDAKQDAKKLIQKLEQM